MRTTRLILTSIAIGLSISLMCKAIDESNSLALFGWISCLLWQSVEIQNAINSWSNTRETD